MGMIEREQESVPPPPPPPPPKNPFSKWKISNLREPFDHPFHFASRVPPTPGFQGYFAGIEHEPTFRGRDPFNQNFRKFRSKTQWIASVQPEKFRKNGSTFLGGPLFPVGPVGILVEWIAPRLSHTFLVFFS